MWVKCVLVDSRVNTLRANPLLFPLLPANQALMHRTRSSGWPYEISDFTEFRSAESERLNCRKGALQQLHGWRSELEQGFLAFQ